MSLSAVFKNMAKQAVDCKNMVRVKVWHTHTPLSGYSKITVNDLDLTYGRTMARTTECTKGPQCARSEIQSRRSYATSSLLDRSFTRVLNDGRIQLKHLDLF